LGWKLIPLEYHVNAAFPGFTGVFRWFLRGGIEVVLEAGNSTAKIAACDNPYGVNWYSSVGNF
jgi:hypothetical protein